AVRRGGRMSNNLEVNRHALKHASGVVATAALIVLSALVARRGATLEPVNLLERAKAAPVHRVGPPELPAGLATTSRHPALAFEPNVGQTSPQAKFLAHGGGYVLLLTGDGMVLSLRSQDSGFRIQRTRWLGVRGKWPGTTDYGQRTMDLF